MFPIGRRKLLLGASALAALAACNSTPGPATISPDDIVLGAPNAPVTLIEYASATCPHCAHFHETVWDQLKANYIDTGRVRFIFREFPTPPEQVAVAGFQIARCGGATPEQYFARLSEIFREHDQMLNETATMDSIRAKLLEIGASAGLTQDQMQQCITDESGPARIRRLQDTAQQFNVTGTPTLILNGQKLEGPDSVTYEGVSHSIDQALAAHH
jgi:protein-disulfide isomerase